MLHTLLIKTRRAARRLWVRVTLIAALALVAAAMAPLGRFLPLGLTDRLDTEALSALLTILTNSMLTVTTFSLSIMVSAHLAADANATPRAHRLLQEDGRTQTVIATFIGAFIYALTLTVMQNANLFGKEATAVMYLVTVGVIVLVVVGILRWVAHLSGLGSVEATIRRVEERARYTISFHQDYPFLGGCAPMQIPRDAAAVLSRSTGYVQTIDMTALSHEAGEWGTRVHLVMRPGDWVTEGDTLAFLDIPLDEEREAKVLDAIEISDRRGYDQDVGFALEVLAEIAERALSPGINDPRTAIDVTGAIERLIHTIDPERELDEPVAPGVHIAPLPMDRLLLDTIDRIARDGRTFAEVQLTVQRACRSLARHRDPRAADAAKALSARALSYARDGLLLVEDLQRIAAVAPADHMAATTAPDESKESAVEALGEEQESSYFRE